MSTDFLFTVFYEAWPCLTEWKRDVRYCVQVQDEKQNWQCAGGLVRAPVNRRCVHEKYGVAPVGWQVSMQHNNVRLHLEIVIQDQDIWLRPPGSSRSDLNAGEINRSCADDFDANEPRTVARSWACLCQNWPLVFWQFWNIFVQELSDIDAELKECLEKATLGSWRSSAWLIHPALVGWDKIDHPHSTFFIPCTPQQTILSHQFHPVFALYYPVYGLARSSPGYRNEDTASGRLDSVCEQMYR